MDLKEKILQLLPIDQYINRFVPLTKKGRSYFGLCPFHGEKTPSFSVQPDKGFFHCFGCKKSGNLITFAMEYHGMDFKTCLEVLARELGIDPSEYSHFKKGKGDQRALQHELMSEAQNYCYAQLRMENPFARTARDYLDGRGITLQMREHFGLGWAPGGDYLVRHLRGKFPDLSARLEPMLETLSLARKSERDGSYYSFLRSRVSFPIHSSSGQVVAFGGRTIDDNGPKYINSANTPLFDKSQVLYNLHRASKSIRENGFAIIVEGYMDVIGLYKAGVENTLAPLGTALTEQHVKLLSMHCREVLFCMDSDGAGLDSALKGVRLCQQGGLETRVVLLPPGQDPFDFASNNSPTAVLARLDDAESGADFRLKAVMLKALDGSYDNYQLFTDRINPEMPFEKKQRLISALFEELPLVHSQALKEEYLKRAAAWLGVHHGNLFHDYGRHVKETRSQTAGRSRQAADRQSQTGGQGVPPRQLSPGSQYNQPSPVSAGANNMAGTYADGNDDAYSSSPDGAYGTGPAGQSLPGRHYIHPPGKAGRTINPVELRCEQELLALVLLHPELGRFRPGWDDLDWQGRDEKRLAFFLVDRLDNEESIALRDLFGSPIGDDYLNRLNSIGMQLEQRIGETDFKESDRHSELVLGAYHELYNRKSLLQIDRQLKAILDKIARMAGEGAAVDELRIEMIRLKNEKIKLQTEHI